MTNPVAVLGRMGGGLPSVVAPKNTFQGNDSLTLSLSIYLSHTFCTWQCTFANSLPSGWQNMSIMWERKKKKKEDC
jgi:hypothetical protein